VKRDSENGVHDGSPDHFMVRRKRQQDL